MISQAFFCFGREWHRKKTRRNGAVHYRQGGDGWLLVVGHVGHVLHVLHIVHVVHGRLGSVAE
jgi:hypothetical protein